MDRFLKGYVNEKTAASLLIAELLSFLVTG